MKRVLIACIIGSLWMLTYPLAAEQAAPSAAPAEQPRAAASPPSLLQQDADRAAREEIVRLQEAQWTARKLIADGERLSSQGKYEEASGKLTQALNLLPVAKATEADYHRAVTALAHCQIQLAEAALKAGDRAKARQLAEKTLERDPSNRAAEAIIVKVKRGESRQATAQVHPPAEVPPDETPDFLSKKTQIRKLFREGKILLNSGQFDAAEQRFQQVLIIDPYNEDAHVLLGDTNKQRAQIAEVGADMARGRRLREVTESWIPSIGREIKVPGKVSERGPLPGAPTASLKITQKLNTIIIPEINLRDAVITDVIRFLGEQSQKLDPEKEGVNFVLQLGQEEASATVAPVAPVPPPTDEVAPGGVVPPPVPVTAPAGAEIPGVRKITLSLRQIPLIEALKYVTSVAVLKYRIEPSAVLILPKDAPEGALITRTYPVAPGAISKVVAAPTATTLGGERTGAGTAGVQKGFEQTDVKAFFAEAGVPFPTGSSLVYNDRISTVIVRNTPENLEIFERILSTLNVIPSQVEIEAKFVDINQNDLDDLGFKWQVGRKVTGDFDLQGGSPAEGFPPGTPASTPSSYNLTSGLRDSSAIGVSAIDALLSGSTAAAGAGQIGTIRGILTDPQFQVVIQALSQKHSADVLSAPKITTISGNAAQIKVVQEFIYPTSYAAPQVAESSVTPAIPSDFKTRDVGVLLNVTPSVGADGYTINLTLVPEVSEFLGFLDYSPGNSVAILNSGSNTGGGGGGSSGNITVQNIIKQPLFASRTLTTSVVVWDGQTVVLGGMISDSIQSVNDKVPFLGDIPLLGRLFQSKSSVHNKRNLLIFVTARLIDPAGNLIHKTETATIKP